MTVGRVDLVHVVESLPFQAAVKELLQWLALSPARDHLAVSKR